MKILVTGGAGFIGSNLCEALLKRGDEVVCLDNFATGKIENILPLSREYPKTFKLIVGDIRNISDCEKAIEGCEAVLHEAALGLTPDALMTQLKTFGFIFEQMCIRDLRAYTPGFNNHISYYRDRYGLEADLVLHLADGRYALIECKLGSGKLQEGATHLLKLRDLIREHNKKEKQVPLREPDLLIILTAGEMAYTRTDGVKVIPLACLKP